MTETMIEKVARALCERAIRHARRWDTTPEALEEMLPESIDYSWRDHVDDARAALSAMREPSEGVLSKMGNAIKFAYAGEPPPAAHHHEYAAELALAAMIDAALSETSPLPEGRELDVHDAR
jgi:hypothetical protein